MSAYDSFLQEHGALTDFVSRRLFVEGFEVRKNKERSHVFPDEINKASRDVPVLEEDVAPSPNLQVEKGDQEAKEKSKHQHNLNISPEHIAAIETLHKAHEKVHLFEATSHSFPEVVRHFPKITKIAQKINQFIPKSVSRSVGDISKILKDNPALAENFHRAGLSLALLSTIFEMEELEHAANSTDREIRKNAEQGKILLEGGANLLTLVYATPGVAALNALDNIFVPKILPSGKTLKGVVSEIVVEAVVSAQEDYQQARDRFDREHWGASRSLDKSIPGMILKEVAIHLMAIDEKLSKSGMGDLLCFQTPELRKSSMPIEGEKDAELVNQDVQTLGKHYTTRADNLSQDNRHDVAEFDNVHQNISMPASQDRESSSAPQSISKMTSRWLNESRRPLTQQDIFRQNILGPRPPSFSSNNGITLDLKLRRRSDRRGPRTGTLSPLAPSVLAREMQLAEAGLLSEPERDVHGDLLVSKDQRERASGQAFSRAIQYLHDADAQMTPLALANARAAVNKRLYFSENRRCRHEVKKKELRDRDSGCLEGIATEKEQKEIAKSAVYQDYFTALAAMKSEQAPCSLDGLPAYLMGYIEKFREQGLQHEEKDVAKIEQKIIYWQKRVEESQQRCDVLKAIESLTPKKEAELEKLTKRLAFETRSLRIYEETRLSNDGSSSPPVSREIPGLTSQQKEARRKKTLKKLRAAAPDKKTLVMLHTVSKELDASSYEDLQNASLKLADGHTSVVGAAQKKANEKEVDARVYKNEYNRKIKKLRKIAKDTPIILQSEIEAVKRTLKELKSQRDFHRERQACADNKESSGGIKYRLKGMLFQKETRKKKRNCEKANELDKKIVHAKEVLDELLMLQEDKTKNGVKQNNDSSTVTIQDEPSATDCRDLDVNQGACPSSTTTEIAESKEGGSKKTNVRVDKDRVAVASTPQKKPATRSEAIQAGFQMLGSACKLGTQCFRIQQEIDLLHQQTFMMGLASRRNTAERQVHETNRYLQIFGGTHALFPNNPGYDQIVIQTGHGLPIP